MRKVRRSKIIYRCAALALAWTLGFTSHAAETPDESDVQEIQQEIDNQQQEIDKTQQEIDETEEKQQKLEQAKAEMENYLADLNRQYASLEEEIEDLNQQITDKQAEIEQAQADQNVQARPALAEHVEDMAQYDTVILGYPNWWASIPMPVASFLEEYDFAGKTILPFCSHGGGRFGQSLTAIAKLVPDATLLEGLAVSYSGGSGLEEDVAQWLEDSGIHAP